MADGFIGEIRLLPYKFTPQGWLPCDGSTLYISQYQALYAVVGANYGPFTQTTFTLPDLRGLAVTSWSNAASAGLTPYSLGEVIGQTTAQATLPNHTHQMSGGVAINGGSDTLHPAPTSNSLVSATYGQFNYAEATSQSQLTGLATTLLTQTGNSQAHANISPYLPVQFCICWEGVYPINPN